ncbi:MAG: hypothetical protein AABY26_01280 [Nanoarchaeota archaeon]
MNEIETTGHYLLTLNQVYQERGWPRAIIYELGSTAYSLLNRLGRIPEFMESAGYSIGFGFDVWGRTYPLNLLDGTRATVSVREREMERIRAEREERIRERVKFILRAEKKSN